MTAQTQAEALQLAQFFESMKKSSHRWHDGTPVHEKAAAELRRLHGENEGLQKSYDEAIGLLAQCRDAFSLPTHGTKADDHWIAAISFPEDVPLFVKARIAELEAQAQPAREPLTDGEIERLHADLQARKLAAQEALYQSRIGMQCGMCTEGRYQASSNGYSKFHRCDKCIHVPFWSEDGKEFTAHAITKEKP